MTIDNVSFFYVHVKLFENIVHYLFLLDQSIIMVFSFNLYFFICDKIAFKCCHFFLTIYRRILIRPNIPHNILTIFMFIFIILLVIPFSCIVFKHIIKFFSRILFITDLYFTELTVLIKGYTSMIKQIRVIAKIQTSLIKQETNMLL